MISSHKATVFVLQALLETQGFFSIDPELIQGATRWIQLRQDDDGSFPPLPADIKIPTDNLTSTKPTNDSALLQQIAEITAETLVVFHEYPIESGEEIYSCQKAVKFLETVLPRMWSSEAIASVTLALVLYQSKLSPVAVERLRNASMNEDGEFGWSHGFPKRDAADWLYESEGERTLKEPLVGKLVLLENYESVCNFH